MVRISLTPLGNSDEFLPKAMPKNQQTGEIKLKNFFNQELEKISLVVMGDQDHVFFEAARKFVNVHSQKAKLVIFEQCGHICNIEQYELFNKTTLAFLKS